MVYDTAAYSAGTPVAHDNLIAGGTYTTRVVVIDEGQDLSAGAVLGKITSGGNHALSLSASEDGSEVPDMVLAQDCDASSGDTEALAYETGQLVGSALTVGTGHSIASIREGLRSKGLVIDD